MKSGGIFGGGQQVPVQAPPAPGVTPIGLAPAEVKGGIDAGGLSLNDIHNWNVGFGIGDRAVGIANNIASYLISMRQFDMYERIADAKIAAERELNGFQKELATLYMNYADEADKRRSVLEDKVSARHENTEIEKHRISVEAEKEMRSEDILDRAFGVRSEPYYGLPV